MKLTTATQLLNKTVSVGIKICKKMDSFNVLLVDRTIPTANFVERIDKIFDCLNS